MTVETIWEDFQAAAEKQNAQMISAEAGTPQWLGPCAGAEPAAQTFGLTQAIMVGVRT